MIILYTNLGFTLINGNKMDGSTKVAEIDHLSLVKNRIELIEIPQAALLLDQSNVGYRMMQLQWTIWMRARRKQSLVPFYRNLTLGACIFSICLLVFFYGFYVCGCSIVIFVIQ
jgi:hypothetical protein